MENLFESKLRMPKKSLKVWCNVLVNVFLYCWIQIWVVFDIEKKQVFFIDKVTNFLHPRCKLILMQRKLEFHNWPFLIFRFLFDLQKFSHVTEKNIIGNPGKSHLLIIHHGVYILGFPIVMFHIQCHLAFLELFFCLKLRGNLSLQEFFLILEGDLFALFGNGAQTSII